MDRKVNKEKAVHDCVAGKVVLITGSTDGIGEQLAFRLAKQGAHVLIVARNQDKLDEVVGNIVKAKGKATAYKCDLAVEADCTALVEKVSRDFKHIDYLINNAGRSIRRSVEHQYDRFHDFSRCIDLNYYGSLRMILGFLPNMRKRKSGSIINISSIGAVTNAPR